MYDGLACSYRVLHAQSSVITTTFGSPLVTHSHLQLPLAPLATTSIFSYLQTLQTLILPIFKPLVLQIISSRSLVISRDPSDPFLPFYSASGQTPTLQFDSCPTQAQRDTRQSLFSELGAYKWQYLLRPTSGSHQKTPSKYKRVIALYLDLKLRTITKRKDKERKRSAASLG